jgi:hypothetical protein
VTFSPRRLKRALRTLVLASAAGLACGCPVLAQHRATIVSNTVGELVVTSEPVTVALAPASDFATALAAARQGRGAVALAVEGIEGRATQPISLNVFVDKPDAARGTSTDDPHLLGNIYIIPARGLVRRTGRAFDLSSVDLADPAAPLRVTLVPVVGTDAAAPRDASLTIERIYIRRED